LLWFWFGSLTALTAVAAVIAMPVDDSGTTEHCLTTGWRVTVIAGDRDPGETQMSEIRILVHNVPPEGWQWRLVAGVIRSKAVRLKRKLKPIKRPMQH
jgi:hypothetical protein